MCSVLPQALQGGIICVLKTHFLVLNKTLDFVKQIISEVISFRVYLPFWLHYSVVKVFHFRTIVVIILSLSPFRILPYIASSKDCHTE